MLPSCPPSFVSDLHRSPVTLLAFSGSFLIFSYPGIIPKKVFFPLILPLLLVFDFSYSEWKTEFLLGTNIFYKPSFIKVKARFTDLWQKRSFVRGKNISPESFVRDILHCCKGCFCSLAVLLPTSMLERVFPSGWFKKQKTKHYLVVVLLNIQS